MGDVLHQLIRTFFIAALIICPYDYLLSFDTKQFRYGSCHSDSAMANLLSLFCRESRRLGRAR
jgi:hypothetical protein